MRNFFVLALLVLFAPARDAHSAGRIPALKTSRYELWIKADSTDPGLAPKLKVIGAAVDKLLKQPPPGIKLAKYKKGKQGGDEFIYAYRGVTVGLKVVFAKPPAKENRAALAQGVQDAFLQGMPFVTSREPKAELVKEMCGGPNGPAPLSIQSMQDSAGNIGGYLYRRLILDSPISYLDCDGDQIAMFHIFGPDAEKRANEPIIESLRKAFPLVVDLKCP